MCIQHFCQWLVHFLIFHLAAKSGTMVCVRIGSWRMRSSDHSTFIKVQFNDITWHKITFLLNIHTNFCFFPSILHFDNISKEWMYHSTISLRTLNENLYVHVIEAFVSYQNMFKEIATFKNVNVNIIEMHTASSLNTNM